MPEIKILFKSNVVSILSNKDNSLLTDLQENGFDIYSPCGGKGTCGKCKVFIKGEGDVSSCIYKAIRDIEIILPEKRETKILVVQNEHTIQVPFIPGDSAGLSLFPYGIAIDIGTTTLVFYLINLITGGISETRGVINPQTRHGADIISRINYAAQNPGGLETLQKEILDAINQQIDHFIEFAEITSNELVKISIAGNTTMLHLLLGVDPLSIALAPFIPTFVDEQIRR